MQLLGFTVERCDYLATEALDPVRHQQFLDNILCARRIRTGDGSVEL
jgi:hypothetical protein